MKTKQTTVRIRSFAPRLRALVRSCAPRRRALVLPLSMVFSLLCNSCDRTSADEANSAPAPRPADRSADRETESPPSGSPAQIADKKQLAAAVETVRQLLLAKPVKNGAYASPGSRRDANGASRRWEIQFKSSVRSYERVFRSFSGELIKSSVLLVESPVKRAVVETPVGDFLVFGLPILESSSLVRIVELPAASPGKIADMLDEELLLTLTRVSLSPEPRSLFIPRLPERWDHEPGQTADLSLTWGRTMAAVGIEPGPLVVGPMWLIVTDATSGAIEALFAFHSPTQ